MNFKEFLNEASVRMTKGKWQSAMDMVPKGERGDFMKFAASVEKLYGISTNNPGDYYKVQNAFKSLTGQKSAPTTKATPAPQAPKAEPVKPVVKEAPKDVPGLKVRGKYGSIIGSGELFSAIDQMIPLVRDNGALYKSIEVYLDNLYKYRASQGSKPSARETQHIGEVKVLLSQLRHHLVELSRQTGLSYTV
jgi:hypothetical protein